MHTVTFELESGERVTLYPGDFMGRSPQCALLIQDVRISEYHAALSDRREGAVLLAMRGRVTADGKPKSRLSLEPGRHISLAGFFGLKVISVDTLPSLSVSEVGAVEAPVPLIRIISLRSTGRPVAFFDPTAAAHVSGGAVPILSQGGSSTPLEAGRPFEVAGRTFELTREHRKISSTATADKGQFDQGLRIIVRFDVVQVDGEDGKSVSFDGLAARALTELAEIKAPVAWSEFARILWQAPADSATRHRWDQLLVRIRTKLRAAGLRGDLVRANRSGLVELVLGPNDKVRMRT